MRLYDCKVQLNASRDNEVRKTDVTAAEIMVLRAIHGPDTVVEIKPGKMDKRQHSEERARLFNVYVGQGEGEALGGFAKQRAEILMGLFGPKHTLLPVELADPEDADDEPAEKPKRVTLGAKAGSAESIAAAAALA